MNATIEDAKPMSLVKLPAKILELLHKRDLSQAELARYAGVSPATISRGLNANPELLRDLVPRICKFFDIDAARLVPAPRVQPVAPVQKYLFGDSDPDGLLTIGSGYVIRKNASPDDAYHGALLLLGPTTKAPREADLVWVLTKSGRQHVRTWTQADSEDGAIVLVDQSGSDRRPVVVTQGKLQEVRLVAGVLELCK